MSEWQRYCDGRLECPAGQKAVGCGTSNEECVDKDNDDNFGGSR